MIINLTQSMLSQLKCPEGKIRAEYCSTETKGLLLEVRSSGAATWYLRYKVDSATKYFSFGPLSEVTLSQATKMALDMKAQIRAQGRDPRAEIKAKKEQLTFDEFYEQHLKPYCIPRKRSWARDEQLYRIRIKPEFGNKKLNQISRQQIQTFHTELLAEGLSHASCDLHIRFIRHAFNLAIDWSLFTEKNPAARIPLYNKDNRVNNIPNDAELSRLFTVLKTDSNRPICLIAMFLIATGLRVGETLASQWQDVDIQNKTLIVRATNSKSGRQRAVPLNQSAIAVLQELDTQDKFDHLFINKETGKPYVTIAKVWDRLRKKAGLPKLRCHDLRHLAASLIINAGASLFIVQQVLGHSNPSVTERYAHLSQKTLQEASNKASALIQNAMKEAA